jgi:nitrogen fixation NifU-like protein
MELYKNPLHKGTLKNPSVCATLKNPLCGDEITLELKIAKGTISQAKFKGNACAVTIISSEILIQTILKKKLSHIKNLSQKKFLQTLHLNLTTTRIQCAILTLLTLQKAIESYEENHKNN